MTNRGKLRTICRKGLHPFTPANTVIHGQKRPVRLCRECLETAKSAWSRIGRKRMPNETGWCQKGLHRWEEANWTITKRATLCRECKNAGMRKLRARGKRYCVAKGCGKYSIRQDVQNYICPTHRKNPPSWIATLSRRIVGIEVVTIESDLSHTG